MFRPPTILQFEEQETLTWRAGHINSNWYLYAIAYTIKMSYKTDYKIQGFFEYVVPPLEGFWWQDHASEMNYGNKDAFHWISVIRLPDFITKADFDWAVKTANKKEKVRLLFC